MTIAPILTLGLQNLRRQVNAAFPNRDHTSDGTIGDAAHQAEMSGHNPDDTAGSRPAWDGDPDSTPEIRAWDMDSDLSMHGVDAQDVVDHIRALPNVASVLRYMIYNRTMYHSRDGFAPTPYTGSSAHTEHVHFEGAWSQAADNNTGFDYRLEDLVMPTAQEIADAVVAELYGSFAKTLVKDATGKWDSGTGRAVWWESVPNAVRGGDQPVWTVVADTLTAVKALGSAQVSQTAQLAELTGKDFTDEPAIVAGVLAGLTPALLASAITAAGLTPEALVAAIPTDLAERVLDLLGEKLAAAPTTPTAS